jgi:hypothetical protein
MHPAFAFYVYLCEIGFQNDIKAPREVYEELKESIIEK